MQPRVLLIDDSPLIAKIITSHLVSQGYSVETLSSAAGLHEVVDRIRPHIILVDLGLPGLRGDKVASMVRGMALVRPRIIVISGEDEAQLQQLVAAGAADDYFTKGKPITELQQKIAAQLKFVGKII